MKRALAIGLIGVMALALSVRAQEGGKQEENKEGARPAQEKAKEGGAPTALTVAEVDTNGDGKITAAELKAAMSKLDGGRDGEKKREARKERAKKGKPAPRKRGDPEGEKKTDRPGDEKKEGDR